MITEIQAANPTRLLEVDAINNHDRRQIAREVRVSFGYLQRILNGQVSPSIQIAVRLAYRMGCTLDDIAALKRPIRRV